MNFRKVRRLASNLKNKHWKCLFLPLNRDDAYKTHVPILLFLMNKLKLEYVCESGSGFGSTPVLGSVELNTNLRKHVVIETNEEWAARTSEIIKNFPRSELNVVDHPKEFFKRNNLEFDIIFIDDSDTTTERAETIKACLKHYIDGQIIVIHDYEHYTYRRLVKHYQNRHNYQVFEINSIQPYTAIIGLNNDNSTHLQIDTLKKKIVTEDLSDLKYWQNLFANQ